MGRKKNYEVPGQGPSQTAVDDQAPTSGIRTPPYGEARERDKANIELRPLLGGEDPLGTSKRKIDLRSWLGRGVDPWVWGCVDVLSLAVLHRTIEPSSAAQYGNAIEYLLEYLSSVLTNERGHPLVAGPGDLSPLHVSQFLDWLKQLAKKEDAAVNSTRHRYQAAKFVIKGMMDFGLVKGERARFFKPGALPNGNGTENSVTALSEAEEERLAAAIIHDLKAHHHGRLQLLQRDVQALRFLLVAHRQGANTTPLLEMDRREAIKPGLSPNTRTMTVSKRRGRKRISKGIRAAPSENGDVVFNATEAGVLAMAIRDSNELIDDAADQYRHRVWLYRVEGGASIGQVRALQEGPLKLAIAALVRRHGLLGDDGKRLQVTNRRLRKSFFNRAMRVTDGDIVKTAALMGHTPAVAAKDYPSLNSSDKAEIAEFLNAGELVHRMKEGYRLAQIQPARPGTAEATPVSGCSDSRGGEYAPKHGRSCDRFVMCLFCRSVSVVGEVPDLWRLFSFQEFAKVELAYLEALLGPERSDDERMEDMRQRYRLAIPHIDSFTSLQFPKRTVAAARERTAQGLHPFWVQQMERSRRAHELQDATRSLGGPNQLTP